MGLNPGDAISSNLGSAGERKAIHNLGIFLSYRQLEKQAALMLATRWTKSTRVTDMEGSMYG